MEFLQKIDVAAVAVQFVVLLFSLSIHEASHAWMADRMGDYTARYLGRVTLNPVPHIDLIGTIVFPLLMLFTSIPIIGWAKPVPINPAHLHNPRKDNIYISLAGPGANLLAAFVSFTVLFLLKIVNPKLILAFFSGTQASGTVLSPVVEILYYLFIINFALALFNCIPIPPLDGHWVLYGLLPGDAASALERIGGYGFLIIYALMFFGVLKYIFVPIYWVSELLSPL